MANKARKDGRQEIVIKSNNGINTADVTDEGKLKTSTTVGAVGVGETYGMDLYPSAWVILSGTITIDDWVKITIDGYDNQYTIQEGDTWSDIVDGLVNLINNNSNINSKVDAFAHYKQVFIRGEEQGDQFDGLSISTSISSGATIVADANSSTILRRWKEVLIEEDENDRRFGRIGVFGEVGSRTKAENPIHITVRREVATQNEVVFADKTVPSELIWFITTLMCADDLATEFKAYHGDERDKVESFNGDGSNKDFTLSRNAIANANYVSVTVDGSPLTFNSDFWVYFDINDETKSYINLKNAAPSGTDNVVITYDACTIKLGMHIAANDSKPFTFGAPIKMLAGEYIIVSVQNKSSNTGIAIANINGFYEEAV